MNINTIQIQNKYLWSIAILVLTFLVYFPVFTNGFTNWDDNIFVTDNELIRSFSTSNIINWFSNPFAEQYQPLILLSFAIDYSIDGYNPFVFHLTNLLIHLINTFLVFRFIDLLFKNSFVALLTSLFFGIHTLNVESVAWITERKNVLFTLFYLWSLICYLKYLDRNEFKYFIFALLVFVLALASKGAAVTLPLILVLIDYLYNRPLTKKLVIIEKLPFFALSLFIGIFTIVASQQYGSLSNATGYPIYMRVLISVNALIFYFEKLLLPIHLSAYYTLSSDLREVIPGLIFKFVLVYGLVLAVVLLLFKKKNKYVFFGIVFFIIQLVLFIIPTGVPVLITDRYAYVSFIGLFVIISYGLYLLFSKSKKLKIICITVLSIYVMTLSFFTFKQSKIWHDSISLWDNVIKTTGEFSFPLMKRGIAYSHVNDYDKALEDFNKSIELNVRYPVAYENRGYIYLLLKNYKLAVSDFKSALEMDPQSAYSLRNLGLCFYNLNDYEKGLGYLNQSLEIEPNNAYAYKTRGKLYVAFGQMDLACDDLYKSIDLGLSDVNESEAKGLINEHCIEHEEMNE